MKKNHLLISVLLISTFLFSFFLPSVSFAAPQSGGSSVFTGGNGGGSGCPGTTGGSGIPNPLKGGCSLYALIKLIVNEVFLPLGGVIAVFFIIYSGFLMVTAGGNEEKLSKAKKTFLYTIIGAAILLGAWVIATAVEGTINQIKKGASIEKHFDSFS